jgi:peptidoglycan/xylan/chitin deacetylase (PgdA/CDA1 family)
MVHRTPFFLPLLYPSLTWRIPSASKELFLTFDDGPVAGPTDFVLETLSQAGAKATFFCIGDNVKKHGDLFRKICSTGHGIGNHTFNHINGWKVNSQKYVENVKQCSEIMREHLVADDIGAPIFRPPYGRITRRQITDLSNYNIIMWDVLTIDYNRRLSSEKCLTNSIRATRNGSIIVFHDSFKAERNLIYALPRFINHFASQGFKFNVIPSWQRS